MPKAYAGNICLQRATVFTTWSKLVQTVPACEHTMPPGFKALCISSKYSFWNSETAGPKRQKEHIFFCYCEGNVNNANSELMEIDSTIKKLDFVFSCQV
jgi:hypothetical protein